MSDADPAAAATPAAEPEAAATPAAEGAAAPAAAPSSEPAAAEPAAAEPADAEASDDASPPEDAPSAADAAGDTAAPPSDAGSAEAPAAEEAPAASDAGSAEAPADGAAADAAPAAAAEAPAEAAAVEAPVDEEDAEAAAATAVGLEIHKLLGASLEDGSLREEMTAVLGPSKSDCAKAEVYKLLEASLSDGRLRTEMTSVLGPPKSELADHVAKTEAPLPFKKTMSKVSFTSDAEALDAARSAADAGGPLDSSQTLEVPDLRVDVATKSGPDSGKVQTQADRLRAAVAGAVADFGNSLDGQDPEVQSALADWKAGLDSHVADLQRIVQQKCSPKPDEMLKADGTMVPASASQAEDGGKADTSLEDVDDVRGMRQQLASVRTGRDVEEVTSAWADPEECEKEVAELRRVRRQIRCLFGGMIGSLPESNLRVDDLLSSADNNYAEPLTVMTPAATSPSKMPPRPPRSPTSPKVPEARSMPEAHFSQAAPSNVPGIGDRGIPLPESASPRRGGRPRSGGTESLGSVTNSSVAASWTGDPEGAREEQRRKEERRAERRKRREQAALESPRPMKKDDGAMPSKQWNWAEEVVKASLDPGNQWEFPAMEDNSAASKGRGQPQWEQPRQVAPRAPGQRGNDIALKARERADEVMRSERDRQRNLYDPAMEVAYR